MRIVRIEETIPGGAKIRLHHLTDLHTGAPDFDEDAFKQRVKLIEEDDWARWTHGGDGGDLIRFNDRRYQPTELHPRYRNATDIRYASLEHQQELLAPIIDKCWGIADGNHEKKLNDHYGGNFGVELSVNLGKPRLWVGYRGFVYVQFQKANSQRRLAQLIDLQHGWQAGRSSGSFYNQAEKEIGMTEADIVLRGHSHKPNGAIFATLGLNSTRTRIVKRHRTCVNGGSWRHGYRDNLAAVDPNRLSEVEGDMWQETKGFRAELTGGPVIVLHFEWGGSKPRATSPVERDSAVITHSLVKGDITADTLGLS